MSRRSNMLGGVGVEVSPSSTSTINNIVNVRYPSEGGDTSKSLQDNPYQDKGPEEVIKDEKHLIEALSLMVDIVYNNPFFINKLVVTDRTTLAALIRLLTDSDGVDIQCEEPECSCLSKHLMKVSAIHIIKGTITSEFKYSHQDAKRILDEHHICIKFVSH